MPNRTTLSSWARSMVAALELGGVDCRLIFTQLGLDYAALDNPDARFAQDDMTRLWRMAVEQSGNPAIGLNMAETIRPSAFNVVGYALMSSSNLLEGFQRMVRYQRIIAEGADLSLVILPDCVDLCLAIHGDQLPPARQSAEAGIAFSLAFCRWLSGGEIEPLEVRLCGEAPVDVSPYIKVFGCAPKFAQPDYALRFSRESLQRPLPSANDTLAQLHDHYAGEYLARFGDSRMTHQVRQLLCRLLPQGEPKRDDVAQRLNVSSRTLQRRLQEEGTGFQQLLDECRRGLALQYLAQANLSLLEVAYLLGFADPSNFFRAFRRWFAMTPGEYREQKSTR
ncbi:AraC family transcriptional regulator [Atopomonas sediminilitoris]|uniref:AraC family transcriptional regulator n=1 Tax=Atopomonas sediminilitoris TaxID=2919919 RepID=UPI001F4E164C|nr:AraC family transcriptional regulator [Atopomonas sediminilitoris]MCJ8169020.1 AraC family transcriptional regulator [Atopomonas sediminilitoris]